MIELTQEYLKERLHYNPETGVLTWKEIIVKKPQDKSWNTKYANRQAGVIHHSGYIRIQLGKKTYAAHRLAYIYMKGFAPGIIDHKDNNPLNNSWKNLRGCTNPENARNSKSRENSSSKYKGVCFHKRTNKWQATITCSYKNFYLGTFIREQDAARAYDKKALELFGEFANLNFPEEING